MKIKILTAFLISSFIFSTAFALTEQDVQLLYEMGFISADKMAEAKAAATKTNTKTETKFVYGSQNTSSSSGSCLRLSYDLVNGVSGAVVTSLQNFLKSQGHFSGESTGYFGNLTQQAVEKFQKAQGIVLNGTPETTGLGKVGPTTRSTIEKISCATANATAKEINDFFGFDLNKAFNTPANYNYQVYDFNDYNVDLGYNVNMDYDVNLDYEFDFDYDVDLDYEFDFDDIDLGFDDANDEDALGVLLFAKAVNGQYLRGGNKIPVAVASTSSKQVQLKWTSKNAGDCNLSGDFTGKSAVVPKNGSADVTLLNPTGGRAANGDLLYRFRINCYATSTTLYTIPATDNLLLWLYNGTTTAQQ